MKWLIALVLVGVVGGAVWWWFDDEDTASDDEVAVSENDHAEATQDEMAEFAYVVETEVDGPQDCTPYEAYDAEQSVCYFECADDEECDQIEALIDDALAELEEDYTAYNDNFVEFEGDADTPDNVNVVYTLSPGEQFTISEGEETPEDAQIREWLAVISPDAFSDNYIDRLVIYTDPTGDTAAYVSPDDETLSQWSVNVNRSTLEDGEQEMVFTLIHEFAHVLTLNAGELAGGEPESTCRTLWLDEGCVQPDAYLQDFYTQFWTERDYPAEDEPGENYANYPDDFVSDYAGTNVVEDVAESYATFVLQKQPTAPSSLSEQKVAFFYAYPELVEHRAELRRALAPFVRERLR